MKEKIALITGSSRGLGFHIAKKLSMKNFNIILTGRSLDALELARSQLKNKKKHQVCYGDLLNHVFINNLCGQLPTPDVIIHNLGGKMDGDNQPLDYDILIKSIEHNLGIATRLNKYYLPRMQKRKSGRIIHISSDASETGNSAPGYVAAKAAINAYVKSAARYYAKDNVMICAVLPGIFIYPGSTWDLKKNENPNYFEKKMNEMPLGRFLEVEDIAEQVALIAHSRSMAYAGELIRLSGGR